MGTDLVKVKFSPFRNRMVLCFLKKAKDSELTMPIQL